MDEKESLKRQIQLLQGLIDSHKNIHGNAPANPRWQAPVPPPHGVFRGVGYRQPATNQSSWRKKYSLVNRTSQGAEASGVTAYSSGEDDPHKIPAATAPSRNLEKPKLPGNASDASAFKWRSSATQGSRTQLKPWATGPVPSTSGPRGAQPIESGSRAPAHGHTKETLRSQPEPKVSSMPLVKPTPVQVLTTPQTLSKKPPLFPAKTKGNCSQPKPNAGSSTRTALSAPQKCNQAATANKVYKSQKTKYIWVAKPPVTTKVSPSGKKMSADQKQKPPEPTAIVKVKKNGANPKTATLKSPYKWKAVNDSSPSQSSALHRGVQGAGPITPKHNVPAMMAAAASYRDPAHNSYKVKSKTKIIKRRSNSRSPVDKKSSPLAPVVVRSHYFLRRRSSPRVKSPPTIKRSSPRVLVHLSKHRLRRLPPPGKQQQTPPTREASSPLSLKTSSSSSRVINTRYRIVKRSGTPPLGTSPLSTLNSSLNWRTRLLLLSRLRQKQNQQRWRSRGLCVIGGVMYRVSANKLSKTWSPGSGGKTTPKTGKVDLSSTSPGSLYPSRSATPSRYIASRAIQRSLAIIRQAQHKKEKKEYCMYYNRFGKCNRGDKCPYIHDPEKVAVCTRFLRGTCKKIDGTCPFSHQVSKDKMPVCSYFLKGFCHNNDCPYSHVYVSRKAEVCQDFLKGYCPMGAKCKKKHTLLCPHYARDGKCPQGTKCKLQHRQRKRRLDVTAPQDQTPTSTKQRRKTPERSGKSPETVYDGDNPTTSNEDLQGSSGLQSCPSFISLNCSPASEGTSERVKSSENSGKPLQIKPRL
ncbi:zinc finger CCCH domain-containing protein 3 isoform X2 [Hyla sarda]|uniref:zinc finger CCCH domain-containing protein 3 isoform X2 n=1 Tax=Hyla sarda TaxID=327740 RepID=UPI0024C26461|nr:zinc finger CCCH domain-containing protein 3 isoform X2 [Hyla sarda]